MASEFELRHFGDAFEVRERDVQTRLNRTRGLLSCSLRPCFQRAPRAAEALLGVVGGGRLLIRGCRRLGVVLLVILTSGMRLLVCN